MKTKQMQKTAPIAYAPMRVYDITREDAKRLAELMTEERGRKVTMIKALHYAVGTALDQAEAAKAKREMLAADPELERIQEAAEEVTTREVVTEPRLYEDLDEQALVNRHNYND